MIFSLSIRQGHRAGNILLAQSSSPNASEVTNNAINAAFLAWTKGSRSERVNAAIKTLDLVLTPKFLDILPKQIVVFVRIPGCSSFEVLAKYLSSSPLMVLSDNFPMMVKTALTVCSRTMGATSVKPVTFNSQLVERTFVDKHTICGNILSLTTFCGNRSIMSGKLSNRQTRMARSGLAKSRTTAGVTFVSNSSSESFLEIFMTTAKTLGPPPPNSTDFRSSGRTFIRK